jgi:hypothetical protein
MAPGMTAPEGSFTLPEILPPAGADVTVVAKPVKTIDMRAERNEILAFENRVTVTFLR